VPSPDLLTVCISAFISVCVLLAGLAIVMRIILLIFPQVEEKTDAAMIAAAASVIQTVYPGTRIVKVEEIP
jgi:hypothetical protein